MVPISKRAFCDVWYLKNQIKFLWGAFLITHISKTSPADKRNENPLIKYSIGLKCNPVVIIAAKESLKGFDAFGL